MHGGMRSPLFPLFSSLFLIFPPKKLSQNSHSPHFRLTFISYTAAKSLSEAMKKAKILAQKGELK
jgi:hypothetical protein